MTLQEKYSALLAKYRQLQQKQIKKKTQFSQKVCVFGLILVTFAWLANFLLLWFDKMPMSDVTIAIITMFGGFATGGYFALSGVRDCSRNKYGGNNL
ncbi:MAG: hypothetical protein FWH10_08050 [Oscillospiraceae bacterium]|nr:hypothetical protein [Oscillospiraceae bacterium]